MKTGTVMPLTQVFVSISDPRSKRHTQHDLAELLSVMVCAVLSGADDFVAVHLWAKAKLDWLRGFMKLEGGIPSHDTLGRVFGMIAPEEFEAAFRRWVGMVVPALAENTVVAIDGKSSRRTANKKEADSHPLHLVSAFAAGIGVVLGQTATAEKSNEITAIPVLLKTLALEGTTVTIDAMGTQTKIAQTIREKQADYVLCVKDNHPGLLDSIMFAGLDPKGKLTPTSVDEVTVTKNNHGRIETRRCWAYDAVDRLYNGKQWQDLRSFAVIERERTMGDRTSVERAYYISSLPADAARIARAVKSHWEVENRLHWCLDVQLNEDQSRVRTGFAANNLAIVRHIVMNLLRLNSTVKAGIKNKRLLASASDEFRAEVLGFMT
ncbi:MAG: ISAs1 family transposase [Zoogloea sp.]|uniref:ISAs1 family transposase n=1 Tax=Zoogloea sp. TaxID=49181 RepID=UPI002606E813|nr:ISAs1 family transposase [Zoogloea sp.]MDD2990694.1 ISAs1 family transposase [Zoogloea sp.]